MNLQPHTAVSLARGLVMQKSYRHHHTPEMYLRQFAEPMFGTSIRVFERKTGRWDPTQRTPHGIGWCNHLYSAHDSRGERHDGFERFLAEFVDAPCADAVKKAAVSPWHLSGAEKEMLAVFIGFLAARAPDLIEAAQQDRELHKPTERWILQEWCKAVKQKFTPKTERYLMKEALLLALLERALAWAKRIVPWKWQFLKTTRDAPFIVSDWPVLGQEEPQESGVYLLTVPVSAEVALLTSNHPDVAFPHGGRQDVKAINERTLFRATRFVVCPQESFPSDESLAKWASSKK